MSVVVWCGDQEGSAAFSLENFGLPELLNCKAKTSHLLREESSEFLKAENPVGKWIEWVELTVLEGNQSKTLEFLNRLASYDIQSTKRGSDQKVGDTLTLEGGVGGAFRKGLTNVGLIYYTQWKITEDRIPASLPAFRGKHRYIGLGPEFNNTWIVKERLLVVATFRYLFETGNRVATQGNAFGNYSQGVPSPPGVGATKSRQNRDG